MKPKILIAGDVPSNVRMPGELLKDECELFAAGDGVSAVELAETALPDLTLPDVVIPV